MRLGLFLLTFCIGYFTLAQNSLVISDSYIVLLDGDTVYGGVRLKRQANAICFLANGASESISYNASEVSFFKRNNEVYTLMSFEGKPRFMRRIHEHVLEYEPKGQRFFIDIPKKRNVRQIRRYQLKKKYVIVEGSEVYKVTRFTHLTQYKKLFGLEGKLLENCHFYDFELDIASLLKN